MARKLFYYGEVMNEIIKSLKNRKSVRQFLEKEIPAEIKAEILNAALTAPTAGNMTLYTVLDITVKAKIIGNL